MKMMALLLQLCFFALLNTLLMALKRPRVLSMENRQPPERQHPDLEVSEDLKNYLNHHGLHQHLEEFQNSGAIHAIHRRMLNDFNEHPTADDFKPFGVKMNELTRVEPTKEEITAWLKKAEDAHPLKPPDDAGSEEEQQYLTNLYRLAISKMIDNPKHRFHTGMTLSEAFHVHIIGGAFQLHEKGDMDVIHKTHHHMLDHMLQEGQIAPPTYDRTANFLLEALEALHLDNFRIDEISGFLLTDEILSRKFGEAFTRKSVEHIVEHADILDANNEFELGLNISEEDLHDDKQLRKIIPQFIMKTLSQQFESDFFEPPKNIVNERELIDGYMKELYIYILSHIVHIDEVYQERDKNEL
jgi:tRNA A37 threonylcarbamoyladenosine biosynthesis protein TsaE